MLKFRCLNCGYDHFDLKDAQLTHELEPYTNSFMYTCKMCGYTATLSVVYEEVPPYDPKEPFNEDGIFSEGYDDWQADSECFDTDAVDLDDDIIDSGVYFDDGFDPGIG